MRIQSISANTKIYFGPNIPTLFLREADGTGSSPVPAQEAVQATTKKRAASEKQN